MKAPGAAVPKVKAALMVCIRQLMRLAAAARPSRALLNALYLRLDARGRSYFHYAFAKIFRSNRLRGAPGHWKVSFRGKSILMPLTPGRLWLDWDQAVSIVGHDIDLKRTYRALIDSPERPELFIDVGANYGTHSLLFLAQGIRTKTFEPNTSCHEYFAGACRLNALVPDLEPVALGAAGGIIELSYPERDTWLGSTDAQVVRDLASSHRLVTETVEQKRLDDYYPQLGRRRTLVKVDTEGNELAVLQGAARILADLRPKVIFESLAGSDRVELFSLLDGHAYDIHELPWEPGDGQQRLSLEGFLRSASTNYIAVPKPHAPMR